jgi:hypothetical protein
MEQSGEPTNRNRIQGLVGSGERAKDREGPIGQRPTTETRELCGEGHDNRRHRHHDSDRLVTGSSAVVRRIVRARRFRIYERAAELPSFWNCS